MSRDSFEELFADMAPRPPSLDETRARLAELTPVYGRARTRHRLRIGLLATVGAVGLILAGAAVLSGIGDKPNQVDVASGSGREASLSTDADSSDGGTGEPTVVTDDATPEHLRPTEQTDETSETDGAAVPTDGGPDSGTVASTSPDDSPESGDLRESDELPDPAATDREVAQTPGGSATVELTNGALVLIDYEPTAGFTASVKKDNAHEIEIEFRDETSEYKAEFKIRDGEIDLKIKTKTKDDKDHPEEEPEEDHPEEEPEEDHPEEEPEDP